MKATKSSRDTWHGIPRSKIPWYPTIDYVKCMGCGKCVEYCKLGVYTFEEKDGRPRIAVGNPNNCVVLCNGCDAVCPAKAISHPSKAATRETLRNLRRICGAKRQKRKRR